MIIQTDKEGRDVIQQLCDIALKQGGVANLNQVNAILRAVVVLPQVAPVVPIKENPSPKSEVKEPTKDEKAKAEKAKAKAAKDSKKKKSLKAKK